jgi:hypothetical protein
MMAGVPLPFAQTEARKHASPLFINPVRDIYSSNERL